MAGLALAPMATGVSKTCAKAAAIFPIAFLYHLTALASLPVQVALATARTIAGVKGRGVDELFASFFTPRGVRAGSKEDVELIEGLRERHGAAMAAVKDQLDDSETRYKAVYEKLRESERMRLKMQNRLQHAQEDLRAARGEEPPSPRHGSNSFRSGKDSGDAYADAEHDKYPMYFTTALCMAAFLYVYDIPDVPPFERKLTNVIAPIVWTTAAATKHPALYKLLIVGNLVFFGYLTHMLVQWKREMAIGATAPSAAMTFAG